jgi:hypothetical protein
VSLFCPKQTANWSTSIQNSDSPPPLPPATDEASQMIPNRSQPLLRATNIPTVSPRCQLLAIGQSLVVLKWRLACFLLVLNTLLPQLLSITGICSIDFYLCWIEMQNVLSGVLMRVWKCWLGFLAVGFLNSGRKMNCCVCAFVDVLTWNLPPLPSPADLYTTSFVHKVPRLT